MREFYRMMREKKFREAFGISIYRPAIEGLSAQEFEDLRPDFEKMAIAVSEKIPEKIDVTRRTDQRRYRDRVHKGAGRGWKGKDRTSFTDQDRQQSGSLAIKENLELVKKAGKKFFFEARINAHHDDVQDMMTRISLAQVVYSQGHNGQFGNTAELVAAGLIPKDIEGTESTGYRFQIVRSADGKSWYATGGTRPIRSHGPSFLLSRRFRSQKWRRRRKTARRKELNYCAIATRFSRMAFATCPQSLPEVCPSSSGPRILSGSEDVGTTPQNRVAFTPFYWQSAYVPGVCGRV